MLGKIKPKGNRKLGSRNRKLGSRNRKKKIFSANRASRIRERKKTAVLLPIEETKKTYKKALYRAAKLINWKAAL